MIKPVKIFAFFFILLGFLVSAGQTKSASQCTSGQCDGPGEYICGGGTMCCTGDGCPTYGCEQNNRVVVHFVDIDGYEDDYYCLAPYCKASTECHRVIDYDTGSGGTIECTTSDRCTGFGWQKATEVSNGSCTYCSGGGGKVCDCKKSCPASNGQCGVGQDGAPKYNCIGANQCNSGDGPIVGCNGTSISCGQAGVGGCNGVYVTNPPVDPPVYPNRCGRHKEGPPDNDYWVNDYKVCCGCTASSPTAPTLTSPINGQNVDYSSVSLAWSGPSSWGTACPTNTNQYKVYVGTTNPPTTVVATVPSSQKTYDFTGAEGTPVYYWRVGATNGSRETISATYSFTGASDPWWQVKDADVLTLGNLTSGVPGSSGESFILDGDGGFPGVAVYGGTIADFSAGSGVGTVSSTGWLANATILSQKAFNYDYFTGLIPSDIVFNEITSPSITGSTFSSGGVSSRGYYWYRFDGTTGSTLNQDLTISSNVNLGSKKVVLLVKGANLNIGGNIALTDGSGFFMAIVGAGGGNKGNIILDPAVTSLEGVYFADTNFQTGTAGIDSDVQLSVRGAVAAYGGMVLERDLPNDNSTPAELFEYGLDQILLYPPSLSVRKIRWKEVAP